MTSNKGRRHCTVMLAALAGAALFSPAALRAQSPSAVILVLGDSLSAEYGLERGSGWVALMDRRLAKQRIAAKVVNASVSGETTSGGRARLPALLTQTEPTHVIIELGANDALRGLPLAMTKTNLTEMARLAKSAGAKVTLAGMKIPPNYGKRYSDEFAELYESVASSEDAALVPFLLKGVADVPEYDSLFQADHIHPLAKAHPTILDNVWPVLRPQLPR